MTGDRPGRVRRGRGRPAARGDRPAGDRRRRGAACGCTPPASTAASGTSWPACPTRSGWPASGCAPPRARVRGPGGRRHGRGGRRGRDTLQAGDEVFGIGEGSFAEYARARPTSSRPSRRTSPSTRRPPCRHLGAHRAAGRARRTARCRPGSRCWSSARPAASARSPCRSPRRSAPRSPACAARPRSTSSAPSAPTTSSTTPATDITDGGPPLRRHPRHRRQPLADPAPARAHRRRARSSSSAARPAGAGSADSTVSSGRRCCPPFVGQKLSVAHVLGERRGPRRARRPHRVRRGDAGHRPDLPARRDAPPPSSTCRTGTPAARSSSRCDSGADTLSQGLLRRSSPDTAPSRRRAAAHPSRAIPGRPSGARRHADEAGRYAGGWRAGRTPRRRARASRR